MPLELAFDFPEGRVASPVIIFDFLRPPTREHMQVEMRRFPALVGCGE
jgi:hypothetical protein